MPKLPRRSIKSSMGKRALSSFSKSVQKINSNKKGWVSVKYSKRGLEFVLSGAHRWAEAFSRSGEYRSGLRKIGKEWLRRSRRLLRKTKRGSGPMTGHLSRSLMFDVSPYQPPSNPLASIAITVPVGNRARDYFMQRETGGRLPKSPNKKLVFPFDRGPMAGKLKTLMSHNIDFSFPGLKRLFNLEHTFTRKKDNETWIVFGRKEDERAFPMLIIKSKVEQKYYPQGRFVKPARESIKSSGFADREMKKAWRKFMKNRYKRRNVGLGM